MNKLQKLIKKWNFYYVNPNITIENYPNIKVKKGKFKVFKFDTWKTSKEIKDEMKKENYRPATIYELLEYWDGKQWLVSFGSLGAFGVGEGGRRRYLGQGGVGDWGPRYGFLGVCESLKPLVLNHSNKVLGILENIEKEISEVKSLLNLLK